ncbi:5-carboxymethyl-2-hydroxymuconate Delta-isomerase [Roseibium sediminis]|uniref:5-carboxymethyl-2-hydroxymuconate Delta-isomerase n=1 Tax=Roseibium sediminis TaxID=1775174 RepID=UPI00123E2220|nr:5-carboxymethyl-2-hydroxymuconate Delta-isomerase [Roseibium sediminis]
MPHISFEYSANLDDRVDMQALCECLREEAARIKALPLPGLRVRALKAESFSIADGDPKHAFIDISVRLRGGRAMGVKADIAKRIFSAAKAFLEPVLESSSLALSLEIRDIDPDLSPKTGTIRDHLESV